MSTETTQKNSGAPTVFGVIGWIGTLLVFASVGIRFLKPEWAQYQQYAAWAGLALVLVYMAGQWRDISTFYEGRGAKYGTLSIVSILVFVGILVAVNYLGLAPEQALGPDLEPGLQPVGSDHQDPADPGRAGEVHRVRSRDVARHAPRPAGRLHLPVAEGHRRVHRSREEPAARQGRRDHRARHRDRRVQGPHRARHHDRRAGPDQRADQGRHRRDAQGLLHAGPRREGHRRARIAPATAPSRRRWARTTTASNGSCWRRRAKCRPTRRCW